MITPTIQCMALCFFIKEEYRISTIIYYYHCQAELIKA